MGGADTLITYDKLWETMKEKQITQYRLIKYYGFSAGQIGRCLHPYNRNAVQHS